LGGRSTLDERILVDAHFFRLLVGGTLVGVAFLEKRCPIRWLLR
jgi:hypothetical protein